MAIGKATAGKALPMRLPKECCIGCQVSSSAGGGSRGSSSTSPSPPLSPPRRRGRLLRPRPSFSFAGILLRRPVRYLVALPLLYFCGLIMCVGPFSSLVGFFSPRPGSVYRSHLIFGKLWPDIVSDNSSSVQVSLFSPFSRIKSSF